VVDIGLVGRGGGVSGCGEVRGGDDGMGLTDVVEIGCGTGFV
jgi:hypothetical protein